jgi:hypothetical protein
MASSSEHPNGDGITAKLDVTSAGIAVSARKSPAGKSPSLLEQALRLVLFVVWFTITSIAIVATQFLGWPLALYDKNIFYA